MPKLLIHMGTDKTGTSYIQHYFAHQSPALNERGIVYPAAGRNNETHHPMALGLRGGNTGRFGTDESYASMLEKLSEETRDARTVVLSSEIFWSLDPIDSERLGALFSYFDEVSLLFYIRRQDSFAVSYWGSDIKFRIREKILPFEQYCRRRDFDFLTHLERWATVGGANMIVRPFLREAFKNENLIHDVLHYIDKDLTPIANEIPDLKNESWSAPSLELLRFVNALDIPNRDKLARQIKEVCAEIPVARGEGFLTRELQQYLLDRYADRNKELADRYWTKRERDLFFEQEIKSFDSPYSGLTVDDFASIIARIWSQWQQIRPEGPVVK